MQTGCVKLHRRLQRRYVCDRDCAGLCGSRWRRISSNSGYFHSPRSTNKLNEKLTDTSSEEQDHQDAGETFKAQVRRIWLRPTLAGSLSKDLPRLARRITIRTRTGRYFTAARMFVGLGYIYTAAARSARDVAQPICYRNAFGAE